MNKTTHIDSILKKGLFTYSASLPEVKALFAVSVINNVITVLAPFFLIFIMSKIWFIYDTVTYIELALCFFVLGALWFASSYIKDLIFFRMLLKYSSNISMEVTQLLVNLPYSYIGNLPVESQYNRFMPLENISYIWLNKILKSLMDIPLVVFSLSIICYVLGFVYFAYVLFVLILLFAITVYNKNNANKDTSTDTVFHGDLRDYFSNIKLIRSHKRVEFFLDRARKTALNKIINKHDGSTSRSMQDNIVESLLVSLYVMSLGLSVVYALNGDIAIEWLIIVLLLTWFSVAPLKQVLSVSSDIYLANDIVNQLKTLTRINTNINRHKKIILSENFKGNVDLNTVNYKYSNESNFILSNVSFSLARGEVLLLTGPSGSGKSTILNLIMGLEKPNSGVIQIDHDINLIDKESLSKHITFVSRNSFFKNLSILDNIELSSNNKSTEDVKRNLALLGFGADIDSNIIKKYLVSDYCNTKSESLSYQDIINKIILSKITPEIENNIILLDEPFLYAKNQDFERLVKLINEIKINNTIIISSRYNFYHSIANKLLLLNNGKVQKYWGRDSE